MNRPLAILSLLVLVLGLVACRTSQQIEPYPSSPRPCGPVVAAPVVPPPAGLTKADVADIVVAVMARQTPVVPAARPVYDEKIVESTEAVEAKDDDGTSRTRNVTTKTFHAEGDKSLSPRQQPLPEEERQARLAEAYRALMNSAPYSPPPPRK